MNKIKEYYIKARPKLIILLSLILIIVAVINIYFTLEVRVTSNDECLWVPDKSLKDSTEIHFDFVKVNGVSWNAGIRDGDLLLKINGNTIVNTQQAQAILNTVKSGDYADYVVRKNSGELLETKVLIKKLIQFQFLAFSLLGLIWIIIGFIVLMAKQGTIQKIFYLTGATLVLAIVFLILPQQPAPKNIFRSIYIILLGASWCFGLCFIAFYVMYFFWVFPQKFNFVQKKHFKKIFFSIPSLLSVLLFVFIFFFSPRIKNAGFIINNIVNGFALFLGAAFLIGCISLFINYRRLKTREEKKPILVILVSYILAIIAIIYTAQIAPAIADTIFNSPEFYTPIILIIILPISFAYSIFKYQLMDVSIVVKNTIIYGAATLTLAAIYFFIIYVVGQSISQAIGTEYQNIIAGLFFIGFALVFQSTKDKFQEFITAKFYPEQFAYQKVLMRYSNDVASIVGLENIVSSTARILVDALMIDHFGIMLRSQDKKSFTMVRSLGFGNKKLTLMNGELQNFITTKIFPDNVIVIERENFPNVFPASEELLVSENIYTIIPMIINSEVVGLLLFGLKHSGAQFAGKDLELLAAAANQAAISIENARLYEMEAQKLKIERDLEVAKKIQHGLLPKCIPDIHGLDICGEMFSAMQVGGDYFDLIRISDKKLFVVVADVSGKGLSASLYMAKMQTMMQLYCNEKTTPKDVLVEVNRKLYLEMEKGWFVTATLALFDMENRKVTFCRAGHVPVIVSDSNGISSYRITGLGIGLEKGVIFEKSLREEEVDLKPEQVFVFFSDGVTEAMDDKEELFGEDRLSEMLKNNSSKTSSYLMSTVWDELKTYCGATEQFDDQTMVIVKVK
ncbi:MAG TPA: SpoIIE family protein phosphatase [Ignavibacteriaceae bacterium]|nr:SpoIIE family protein phosphatase [Ignavibacteriaceae bacterium]